MDLLLIYWSKFIVAICHIVPLRRLGLMRLVPVRQFIVPPHRTDRRTYFSERRFYRFMHFLAKQDFPFSKRNYYMHKAIANKYGWPYIKETYDND